MQVFFPNQRLWIVLLAVALTVVISVLFVFGLSTVLLAIRDELMAR